MKFKATKRHEVPFKHQIISEVLRGSMTKEEAKKHHNVSGKSTNFRTRKEHGV